MDLDLDLESAAMSKERVSLVQPSKTQRLPVAPEYPLSTPSNSSAIALDSAAPNSDRSMGPKNAVTSEEVISVATSAKTQGPPVAPEHPASTPVHPVSTPFDSAAVVDTSVSNSNRSMGLENAATSEEVVSVATSAEPRGLPVVSDDCPVSAPSDGFIVVAADLSKGGTSTATARQERPTTVTEGSQVLGAVEVEEAALVSDGDSERKVDATPATWPAVGTKEPTKEATAVSESDARSDLDSQSADSSSPEPDSEVLGAVEEPAFDPALPVFRLRVRESTETLSPTPTHPSHYWSVEEVYEGYPVPIDTKEPTQEATPVSESDARSDLDSQSAGNASPEAGSEVLRAVEEPAFDSDWEFIRLRRRAAMERMSPTSTHPSHYWTAEETYRRYPVPINTGKYVQA